MILIGFLFTADVLFSERRFACQIKMSNDFCLMIVWHLRHRCRLNLQMQTERGVFEDIF